MIRGTTPKLEFTLPFEASLIDVLYITFAQNNKVVFEKTTSDCELEGQMVVCKLTQEETLKLDAKTSVEMQVRTELKDGNALASKIMQLDVDRILKDGEI